jgi:hypothetical protein
MKEAFDREIDSLLRRRARGAAESRPWGDGSGDGPAAAHLDADELGAFAEGALPAAARLAAASHLADCERCRGVVVGLARATGAGAEVKHQEVAVPASAESGRTPAWRGLIASLFAPRVMRFAVPVLALSLVGVVSYVALRSSNKGAAVQMARDTGRRPGPLGEQPNTSAAPNTDVTNANTAGVAEQNTSATTTGTTASSAPPLAAKGGHGGTVEQPVVADEASEDAPVVPPAPPPAAAATAGGPAESSKAAAKPVAAQTEEAEAARVENKEKSDNRDRPARAPEPADEIVSGDVASQQRAPRSRAGEVQMPDGGNQRNQKRGADNNASEDYRIRGGGTAASPKESPRERAGSSPETVSRSRATRRAESRADEDEAVRIGETRAAAGHRFRREGNAWVDVNYRPSMSSTGVRRGTEAFRALVADVPEVGRVAGAIGGEVVVVVGGRAYRIR